MSVNTSFIEAVLVLNRLPISRRQKLDILNIKGSSLSLSFLCDITQSSSVFATAHQEAEGDLVLMQRHSINMAAFGSVNYPPLLTELPDPPVCLFYRGNLPSFTLPALAIVGTRNPSPLGIKEARRFGRECAELGLPCISGLALGIDAWAHRGHSEAGGKGIAVLASGLDTMYPASNRELARKILEQGGGLVSEYAPGTAPYRWNFPARNRIISGLARAVLIIQAPRKSGALITADFALDQNRDLWISQAVFEQSQSASCGLHKLYEEGAPLAKDVRSICENWQYYSENFLNMHISPLAGRVPGREENQTYTIELNPTNVQVGRSVAIKLKKQLGLSFDDEGPQDYVRERALYMAGER